MLSDAESYCVLAPIFRDRHLVVGLGALHDLRATLSEISLNLNAEKCFIQSTCGVLDCKRYLQVDGLNFPIVSRQQGFKVLGTQFALVDTSAVELENRMSSR